MELKLIIFSPSKQTAIVEDLFGRAYLFDAIQNRIETLDPRMINIFINDAILEADFQFNNSIFDSFDSILSFLLDENNNGQKKEG